MLDGVADPDTGRAVAEALTGPEVYVVMLIPGFEGTEPEADSELADTFMESLED